MGAGVGWWPGPSKFSSCDDPAVWNLVKPAMFLTLEMWLEMWRRENSRMVPLFSSSSADNLMLEAARVKNREEGVGGEQENEPIARW